MGGLQEYKDYGTQNLDVIKSNTVERSEYQGLVNCKSCTVIHDSEAERSADYVDVKQERNNDNKTEM